MKAIAAIASLMLACVLQASPLSTSTALAAPAASSTPIAVSSWNELRDAIASGSDTAYDISSLPADDSGQVAVTRDITLTAPRASGTVISPAFIVSEGATLTLEAIELQGNEGVGGSTLSSRTATVQGKLDAGAFFGGSLVVGDDAVLHAVPRSFGNTKQNAPAALWLQSVQVKGEVHAELSGDNVTRAIEACASLEVDGGSVTGKDWYADREANGGVSSLIDNVQDVTVINGGTVRGNGNPYADESASPAIANFFTCTINGADVSNGPGDYQQPVLYADPGVFYGAGARPKKVSVDITDTVIEGRPVKSNRPYTGSTPFDGRTHRVYDDDGRSHLGSATSVISYNTQGGAYPVDIRLHAGARIVGSSTALGQGGWGVYCDGARTYVDAGAEVVGGLSTSGSSDVDRTGNSYNPQGGAAFVDSYVTVNGGSVAGGRGPLGGSAIVGGYVVSVSAGSITGGTSSWGEAGHAVYNTGTVSVTGGTLIGGSGPWSGGHAVYWVTNLALSGTGKLVGGTSGSDQTAGGAGIYQVQNIRVTGGSIEGGGSTVGSGGAGIYGVLSGGMLALADCTVTGGDGQKAGGDGISKVEADLTAQDAIIAGGAGVKGGYGIYWTNATTAGSTSITGGTVTGGKSTEGAGATAVNFPAYTAGSTLALEGCTVEAGAGVAGAAAAANGNTGRGVNGNTFTCTVDNAVIKGSSDWGFWAPKCALTVSGDGTLIAGGAAEGAGNRAGGVAVKTLDLEGGTVQPGTFANGADAASAVYVQDGLAMTGGAVKSSGDDSTASIAVENANGFVAISGGEVPIARGGIDIVGKLTTWVCVQENEGTAALVGFPPTASTVHALYAVTALATDGSTLPESAIAGAGRSTIASPFDASAVLCNVDDTVTVTFDRAAADGDTLVVEARDWSKTGAPWVEVDVDDAVLAEVSGVVQATFTVPARDVRVSLDTRFPKLEAGAVTAPSALAYGYEQGNDIALTVKNTGNGKATGLTATLGQGSSSLFEIVTGLAKNTLAPGESATLNVRLKPGMAPAGAAYADTLAIDGDNIPTGSATSFSFEQKVEKAVAVAAISVVVESDGSDAHITATLSAASAAAAKPTGDVSFYEDGALIGSSALVDGIASCDYGKAVGEGLHTVTAVYGGDANYVAPATPPSATFDKHGQMQAELVIDDPGALTYGDPSFELGITGGSGVGTVSYEVPADNGVLDVQGSTARIVGAGSVTVKAVKAGDATFNEAQAVRTVTVARKVAQVVFEVPDAAELIEDGTIKEVAAHVANKVDESDDVAVVLSGHTAQVHGSYVATAVGLAGEHARNYRLPAETPSQAWNILYVAEEHENVVAGIESGGICIRGEQASFKAVGGGMDNLHPLAGDVRWLPLRWSVNPHGEFNPEGPFEATIDTTNMRTGEHTLTVVFEKQRFDGTVWVSTGELSEQKASFSVVEKTPDPVIPDKPEEPESPGDPEDPEQPDKQPSSDPVNAHRLPGATGSSLASTGDSMNATALLGFAVVASAMVIEWSWRRRSGRAQARTRGDAA